MSLTTWLAMSAAGLLILGQRAAPLVGRPKRISLGLGRGTRRGRKNSCKSVAWSAVPDAPMLVYVRMRRWEEQRPRKGQWPTIPHRAIFSSFRFPFDDQWAWFEVLDARFGVLEAAFEVRAEKSYLCLGGGDFWQMKVWEADGKKYGSAKGV